MYSHKLFLIFFLIFEIRMYYNKTEQNNNKKEQQEKEKSIRELN